MSQIETNDPGIATIIPKLSLTWMLKRKRLRILVSFQLMVLFTVAKRMQWNCSVLMIQKLHETVCGVSFVLRTDCRSIYSYKWWHLCETVCGVSYVLRTDCRSIFSYKWWHLCETVWGSALYCRLIADPYIHINDGTSARLSAGPALYCGLIDNRYIHINGHKWEMARQRSVRYGW